MIGDSRSIRKARVVIMCDLERQADYYTLKHMMISFKLIKEKGNSRASVDKRN